MPARTRARRTSISITGIAGIGKSRLGWEFYKYFDGIVQIDVLAPRALSRLRRGRHLLGARGHGADARADRRGRGAELGARQARRGRRGAHRRTRRSAASSSRGSRTCSASTRAAGYEREDLFAAWRLFFERLAVVYPVVMLFEDMQWADASLLDFIEYLLEWSPQLADPRRHAGAAGAAGAPADLGRRPPQLHARSTSSRSRPRRWRSCSPASFPACPRSCGRRSSTRAEGIPLYAVETVRMLLDRGALVQDGPVYRPTGHDRVARGARDAARPDRRPARRPAAEERRVRPGRRRAREDVHASRRSRRSRRLAESRARADPLLARPQGGLRRPGRPALAGARAVRLPPGPAPAGRLRDARQGATARRGTWPRPRYLEQTWSEHEVVEVVASHYLDAYEAAPDAADAAEIRAKAGAAARRAPASAPPRSGPPRRRERYFAQAAELADDPLEQAELLGAGRARWPGSDAEPESGA